MQVIEEKINTSIKIPIIRGVITTPDIISIRIVNILKLIFNRKRTRNLIKNIKKLPL